MYQLLEVEMDGQLKSGKYERDYEYHDTNYGDNNSIQTKEIRQIIYTTNALEGLNRQLRKFTKTRTVFPIDYELHK